ncbi:unnamed protein product [Linum trigynum]|uniref:Uncharacterized protein n=1 Tax=Linum trigynum TaxID=586398 RepID=A0AAV2CMJ1_9ROSI
MMKFDRHFQFTEAPSSPYTRPSYAAIEGEIYDYSYVEKQQLHENLKACVEKYFKAQQQQLFNNYSPKTTTTTAEPNTSYWSTTRGSGNEDDGDDDVDLEVNNNSPASPAVSSVLCHLHSEAAHSPLPDDAVEGEEDKVMGTSSVIETSKTCSLALRDE